MEKSQSESHCVKTASDLFSNQRIRSQQPLCNRLNTNAKSSQARTLAELRGIIFVFYQEGLIPANTDVQIHCVWKIVSVVYVVDESGKNRIQAQTDSTVGVIGDQ